ncbi:MAG: hypothetical protein J6T74_08790 [Clostridia bacterium]|nr:hypothetical protein [Clostridia bacterium]
MFEDRGKYEFTKFDKNARTQVALEEQKNQSQSQQESIAHKRLFSFHEKELSKKTEDTNPLSNIENTPNLNNLPSSSYLKKFENQTILDTEELVNTAENQEEQEQINLEENTKQADSFEYISLLENNTEINVNANLVKKELEKASPKPKKSFSFRIKLFASVYVILVALFGGWVIGNAIDLAKTNAMQYETVTKTEEVSQNIFDIVTSINNLNNASGNPEDETLLVKIATEEIEIVPHEIIEPNEYKQDSNWFDVFTNWFGGIFGGN